ncbi:hypothetical protein BCR44DRAFT_48481 [Catenaria anguillulae PL171]|uniref:Uncharacterized protein n=1 Tax=Catenaria anguillulae PL171 TaxID=765915 RepID=A0A1Y2HMV4_9FUNG|nr:hypothetical protein BCR44DRAFT_48481 [Catenaria anguillulae PL171]
MEPLDTSNLPNIANSTPQELLDWWTNAIAEDRKALVLSAPSLITTDYLRLDNTDLDWAVGICQAPAVNEVTAANAHVTSLQAASEKLKGHSSQRARPGAKQAMDILAKFPCFYTGPGNKTVKFPLTGGEKWTNPAEYLDRMKQLANSAHKPFIKYLRLNDSYHSEALKELFTGAPDNIEVDEPVLLMLKICTPHRITQQLFSFMAVTPTKTKTVDAWLRRILTATRALPSGSKHILVKSFAFTVLQASPPALNLKLVVAEAPKPKTPASELWDEHGATSSSSASTTEAKGNKNKQGGKGNNWRGSDHHGNNNQYHSRDRDQYRDSSDSSASASSSLANLQRRVGAAASRCPAAAAKVLAGRSMRPVCVYCANAFSNREAPELTHKTAECKLLVNYVKKP